MILNDNQKHLLEVCINETYNAKIKAIENMQDEALEIKNGLTNKFLERSGFNFSDNSAVELQQLVGQSIQELNRAIVKDIQDQKPDGEKEKIARILELQQISFQLMREEVLFNQKKSKKKGKLKPIKQ